MSEMVERAAKAVAAAWPRKYRICIEGDVDPRSGSPRFLPSLGGPSFAGLASTALLAALDPEDEALVHRVSDAIRNNCDPDSGTFAFALAAIAALRDSILSPQAELGVKTDG